MAKQTKKLSQETEVTTVNANQKFPMTDNNGNVTIINLANLRKEILSGYDISVLENNIFIMYHAKSDNYPRMIRPSSWSSLQSGGEVADGVVIVEGGKVLVVAPTESSLLWSSAAISGGGTTSYDRVTVYNDWNGKQNTASQVAASSSSAITNTSSYAPGFCSLYSRGGLGAGKWWLPSVGEMMMIYANYKKINSALSKITGSTPLAETWYWTSTEASSTYAWYLDLRNGVLNYTTKAGSGGVRPVSAFIV